MVFENEQECIEAVDRFANNFLSGFLLNDSFDKILQNYTREALKISSLYTLDLGKIRSASGVEKEQFSKLITQYVQATMYMHVDRCLLFRISDLVEPHGLIASWFLTWFVHEFQNFEASLKVFDFQLTELCISKSPIYLASSVHAK